MAKNKLIDLNDHLFAQIERLSDEDLSGDALASEIERSKAITGVAGKVIDNARTVIHAVSVAKEWNITKGPEMLGLGSDK